MFYATDNSSLVSFFICAACLRLVFLIYAAIAFAMAFSLILYGTRYRCQHMARRLFTPLPPCLIITAMPLAAVDAASHADFVAADACRHIFFMLLSLLRRACHDATLILIC